MRPIVPPSPLGKAHRGMYIRDSHTSPRDRKTRLRRRRAYLRKARFSQALLGSSANTIVFVTILCATFWLPSLWDTSWQHVWQTVAHQAGRLRHVVISGNRQLQREEILYAAQLQSGVPIVSFSPHVVRQKIEALGWVREAWVARRFPDTIDIRLREHQPSAIWLHRDSLFLVNAQGDIITQFARQDSTTQGLADLPLITGDDALSALPVFLELLDGTPDFAGILLSARRFGGRRWDVYLRGQRVFRFPAEITGELLEEIILLEKRYKPLPGVVQIFDLRTSGRIGVQRKRWSADDLDASIETEA